MTSAAHAGTHLAAAVVATAMTAAGCGEMPKPAPRSPVVPVAAVKDERPRRTKVGRPIYPPTLMSQGIEADVPVMLTLDETGKVVQVKILKESQYPEFDEAVRRAAMDEQFDPAMRDGVPIAYSVSLTYRFRLERE